MSQLIDNARALVRNSYGSAMADKASDAFCLSLASSQQPGVEAIGLETMIPNQAGLVIEFNPKPSTDNINTTLRKTDEWKNLKKALSSVKHPEAIGLHAEQMLRQSRIVANREDFLKSANLITSQVERQLLRLFSSRTAALENHSTLTQICWLNQTVRTVADASAMSEIVYDPSIKSLDLPRRLEKEISGTIPVVAAPAYRKKIRPYWQKYYHCSHRLRNSTGSPSFKRTGGSTPKLC